LVALLADALPTPEADGVDAVRPDLIGEAFLLRALAPKGRMLVQQTAIVERAFRRAGPPVIATVIRVAQDYALGEAAHASVAWLGHLARLTDDPFALMAIAVELPDQTLALRERAAEITGRIVAGLATRAAADSDLEPIYAQWTSNLGVRLSDLGEREAALAAAREAADLYRALAAQRPDAFRPDLAMSLNNLATMLSELGEREAALAAAREAADLYRALAAQRPDAFRPDLAMSLDNLATMLSELGEREAALAAAREAADLYRELAAQRPDAFRPYLAGSLDNLATMLSELGEREAALAAAREAAELYRALAAQRPDAFRHNLAASLNTLANCLDAGGQRDDGLAANAEAITELLGPFLRHKRAFAEQIVGMARAYIQRCEALGREPDAALLEPVAQGLAELRAAAPENEPPSLPPQPE
jgi:tetratricopeptide (TPR) repeat protein